MSLQAGTQLGPYQILAPLGASANIVVQSLDTGERRVLIPAALTPAMSTREL